MIVKEHEVEKALNFYRDTAPRYAQLEALLDYIDHQIKVERSLVVLETDGTGPVKEAESWVSPRVRELIDERRDVKTELLEIKTLLKAADLKIGAWQTESANNRKGNIL